MQHELVPHGVVRRLIAPALRRTLAGAMAVGLLLGCAHLGIAPARADDAADPVVARRGSIVVTASQVRQILAAADPEVRQKLEHDPAALSQKVRERLLQLVLLADAEAHHWQDKPDVAFRAELARENAIVDSYVAGQVPSDPAFPSEEQVQGVFDANKGKLMVPRQYHLAQIFIAAPQSSGVQGDADALRRINDVKAQIVKNHADFAALAKKSSEDTKTAANGGDLGWLREDAVIPVIRNGIANLPDGAISDPIRSPEGWHLIKVIGTKPVTPATYAEAREVLVRALRQERAQQIQHNFISSLLQNDPIQVNEIEIGKLTVK